MGPIARPHSERASDCLVLLDSPPTAIAVAPSRSYLQFDDGAADDDLPNRPVGFRNASDLLTDSIGLIP